MPRAELFAIVVADETVDPTQELTISSDADVNVKLYGESKKSSANAANFDLWSWLWVAAAARAAPLRIRWTKGHGARST